MWAQFSSEEDGNKFRFQLNVDDVWTGPVKHFKDENSPRLDSDINFCLHANICRVSVKK